MSSTGSLSLSSIRSAYEALERNPLEETVATILEDPKLDEEEKIWKLLEVLPHHAADLPPPEQLGLSLQTWLFLYWEIEEIYNDPSNDFPARKAAGADIQQDSLTVYIAIASEIPHPDALLVKFRVKGVRGGFKLIDPKTRQLAWFS